MEIEKTMQYLASLREEAKSLLNIQRNVGASKLEAIIKKLHMVIRRIYPYPAKVISDLLTFYGVYTDNETHMCEQYLYRIEQVLTAIDTIEDEYKTFGLTNFEPVKEKVETEMQLGSKGLGALWRRKKVK